MTDEQREALKVKVEAAKKAKADAATAAAAKTKAEEDALIAEAKELGIDIPEVKKQEKPDEKKEDKSGVEKEDGKSFTQEDFKSIGTAIADAIKESNKPAEKEEIDVVYG